MIIAKLVGIAWMLSWFFILLKSIVKQVNNGMDPFASLICLVLVWLVVGFAPVLIVKFGWGFIK